MRSRARPSRGSTWSDFVLEPGLAAATLDAVARERERLPGEADHRDRVVEAGPRRPHDVHHRIPAGLEIVELREPAHVCRRPDRVVDHRAPRQPRIEIHPHRFENWQQIAEDDRRIDPEAVDRREHHFGRQPRVFAEFEKPDLLADGPVFGQVAAGLPHQPDGRPLHGLQAAGPHHGRLPAALGHRRGGVGHEAGTGVGHSPRVYPRAASNPARCCG